MYTLVFVICSPARVIPSSDFWSISGKRGKKSCRKSGKGSVAGMGQKVAGGSSSASVAELCRHNAAAAHEFGRGGGLSRWATYYTFVYMIRGLA